MVPTNFILLLKKCCDFSPLAIILFFTLFPMFLIPDEEVVSSCARKKPVEEQEETSQVELKGLLLLGSEVELHPEGYENIRSIETEDLEVPGKLKTLRKKIIPAFFNCPLNKSSILRLKNAIYEYYKEQNRPIVKIQVPEQDISSGVLQLVILEAELGTVKVRGNRNFSSEKLKRMFGLIPGETIPADKVRKNLAWLNRNPFRQVEMVYAPGEKIGTTDIELLVQDRSPWRIFVGIDNTGNDATGNNRLFTGITLGNLFWSDQRLSYQLTTAIDSDRFMAHTINYTLPLPWKHFIVLYGGYSHVDSDSPVPSFTGTGFRNTGWSLQGSFRYDITLPYYQKLLQDVFFGFDLKRTNNNLEYWGVPIISKNVNLFQFAFSYNLNYQSKKITTAWEIQGFYSPGSWLADQSREDYNSLRPSSKPNYFYASNSFSIIWRYCRPLEFNIYFRGQVATTSLLPSEEFGVGGYDTVRGYKERVTSGDNAFVFNGEVRTRKASPAQLFGKAWIDEIQLLGFIDYGVASKNQSVPGETKTSHLLSTGPGIRYNIPPYLTFRADLGFQLRNPPIDGPHRRLHFLLILSY